MAIWFLLGGITVAYIILTWVNHATSKEREEERGPQQAYHPIGPIWQRMRPRPEFFICRKCGSGGKQIPYGQVCTEFLCEACKEEA